MARLERTAAPAGAGQTVATAGGQEAGSLDFIKEVWQRLGFIPRSDATRAGRCVPGPGSHPRFAPCSPWERTSEVAKVALFLFRIQPNLCFDA